MTVCSTQSSTENRRREIARQQIKSGTRLTYFPAEYVNAVGEQVNALTQLEAYYFNSRITAAQMEGNKEWGDTLDRLLHAVAA